MLYQKLGFVVEGTARGAVFRNGAYLDSYYMALQLNGVAPVQPQPLVADTTPEPTTTATPVPKKIDDTTP